MRQETSTKTDHSDPDDLTASVAGVDGAVLPELTRELKSLRRENQMLRERMVELQMAADMDPLVAVYNRRAFIRELTKAHAILERFGLTSSVIFFDLNNFKTINDQYGHAMGDELMRKVGQVLRDNTRECDLVARLGGDEFGIILFKTDLNAARQKAGRLNARIDEVHVQLPTGTVQVSASWGLACCEAGKTAEQTLATADENMYAAKHFARQKIQRKA